MQTSILVYDWISSSCWPTMSRTSPAMQEKKFVNIGLDGRKGLLLHRCRSGSFPFRDEATPVRLSHDLCQAVYCLVQIVWSLLLFSPVSPYCTTVAGIQNNRHPSRFQSKRRDQTGTCLRTLDRGWAQIFFFSCIAKRHGTQKKWNSKWMQKSSSARPKQANKEDELETLWLPSSLIL